MTRHKLLEIAAVIAAAHFCVVLLVAIFPFPGKAAMLDALLVPIDLVWFPTRSTSIAAACVVVVTDSLIWGVVLASIVAARRRWITRNPM